jgi:hypothetical protein
VSFQAGKACVVGGVFSFNPPTTYLRSNSSHHLVDPASQARLHKKKYRDSLLFVSSKFVPVVDSIVDMLK